MAAISNSQASWRDRAIERSEAITDAWEVTKIYAGRLAEWILFACMIANIIEMLPGVALAAWLSNTIMGVQVVMLDVGGFSLASMADQARENGDERAANKARTTGYLLIGIMILTLLLVSVGILWPALHNATIGAEKGLILVRVVMTVIYGHVLHSLRRRSLIVTPMHQQQQQQQQANGDGIQEMRAEMLTQLAQMSEQIAGIQTMQITEKSEPVEETFANLEGNQEGNTEETDIVHIEDYRSEQLGNADSLQVVNETGNKKAITRKLVAPTKKRVVNGRKDARTAAARVLKKFPDIGPSELAQRAQISKGYASKILAEREG